MHRRYVPARDRFFLRFWYETELRIVPFLLLVPWVIRETIVSLLIKQSRDIFWDVPTCVSVSCWRIKRCLVHRPYYYYNNPDSGGTYTTKKRTKKNLARTVLQLSSTDEKQRLIPRGGSDVSTRSKHVQNERHEIVLCENDCYHHISRSVTCFIVLCCSLSPCKSKTSNNQHHD